MKRIWTKMGLRPISELSHFSFLNLYSPGPEQPHGDPKIWSVEIGLLTNCPRSRARILVWNIVRLSGSTRPSLPLASPHQILTSLLEFGWRTQSSTSPILHRLEGWNWPYWTLPSGESRRERSFTLDRFAVKFASIRSWTLPG